MDEVGVPLEIANNLTVPVSVTNFNIKHLQELVNNGKAVYVKRKEIDPETGKLRTKTIVLKNAINTLGTLLEHGDIILRKVTLPSGESTWTEIVVNNGKQKLKPGDKLKRNGILLEKIEYPEKREYPIHIGDDIHRCMQDGDIVLFNLGKILFKDFPLL